MAKAVEAGDLCVDDELHLTHLAAEEEEPELVKLRAALDHRIGEAQLPDLLLEVDAQVRFSWFMREISGRAFQLSESLKLNE